MTRLYLVRHGRAAAGWDTDPDPGLDEIGKQQAIEVGARLAPLGPLHVEVSPLRRCQETAAPLLAAWRLPLMIEPRIAEIPSPEGVAMADRVTWLREAMQGTWGRARAAVHRLPRRGARGDAHSPAGLGDGEPLRRHQRRDRRGAR
jgi:broad specificity phosphatase PhoE